MEFILETTINAPSNEVFGSWLSSEGHSAMTGGEASCSDQVGDEYTAWDGYISGKNLVIEPPKKIIQSWRTTEFKDDENDSQIEVVFEDNDGNTKLTLIHTDVPEDGEHYIKGWEDHYFTPMKAYFERV